MARIRQQAVFYEAQEATLKALGKDSRWRFLLGRDAGADDEHTVRCPPLDNYPLQQAISALRGMQDRVAVFSRFGWQGYTQLVIASASSTRWHRELEQIRVEAVACDYLSGIRENLHVLYQQVSPENQVPGSEKYQALIAWLRFAITGLGVSPAIDKLADSELNALNESLPGLKLVIQSPADYHRQVASLYCHLNLTQDAEHFPMLDMQPQAGDSEGSQMAFSQSVKSTPVHPAESESLVHPDQVSTASGYRVFSREFDRQCHAHELASEQEQHELREDLDRAIREARPAMSRLAGRLMQTLFARAQLDWEQEQEEGLLDCARLDRMIADPLYATPFRQPRQRPERDTVVSLLLDNSGSMRGHPITVAAMCADMLARTLERCGIGVEVLGYTTADWRGGPAREAWVQAGKPPQPGRLNALRHIVYKSADQSWRRARNHLAVMLKPDVLKENIDGEALQWASQRLLQRPEARRLLIVVADGAPSDEATRLANGDAFLLAHLRQVVREIESARAVELMAIGVGYDITGIYRNAVTIPAEGQLGDILISRLCRLFEQGMNESACYSSGNRVRAAPARHSLLL